MKRSAEEGPVVSEQDLEALLARKRMSDPQRERVIANVLRTLDEREPRPVARAEWWRGRWRWRWPVTFTAMATAAAVAVLLLRPRPWRDADWAVKGGGASDALAVEIGCSGGTLDGCPVGSTLIFRAQLAAGAGSGYLVAYADPLSTVGAGRIWYFSGAAAPRLAASAAPATVAQGIHLGPEHAPGVYSVHVLVLRAPPGTAQGAAEPRPEEVMSQQKLRLVVIP